MNINQQDISAISSMIAAQVQADILAKLSPGRWLTLREAMDYAKVKSVTTIRAWIDDGKYKLIEHKDRQDRQIFQAALACYQWQINQGRKS